MSGTYDNVVSDTEIDVIVPDATAAAAGATALEADVTAKFEVAATPAVTDNSVPAAAGDNTYVYGSPVVYSVAPTGGPLTGGNTVVIHGGGFMNPYLSFQGVSFDPTTDTSGLQGIDGTDVDVVSDGEIDVTAPDATAAAATAGVTALATDVVAAFGVTGDPAGIV